MKVQSDGYTHYIVISELPANEQIPFASWLFKAGKTQPIIEAETILGNCAYPWDYEYWKQNIAQLHNSS